MRANTNNVGKERVKSKPMLMARELLSPETHKRVKRVPDNEGVRDDERAEAIPTKPSGAEHDLCRRDTHTKRALCRPTRASRKASARWRARFVSLAASVECRLEESECLYKASRRPSSSLPLQACLCLLYMVRANNANFSQLNRSRKSPSCSCAVPSPI